MPDSLQKYIADFSAPPELYVPFLNFGLHSNAVPMAAISQALDLLPRHSLSAQPWPEYPYQPEVHFSMAHGSTCIYLQFYVAEEVVLARYKNSNDPVYKDSCVEFYISFHAKLIYYNLEFNALGTCCAGFGPDRENRILLHPEQINLIRKEVVLNSIVNGQLEENYFWKLTLVIPVAVFSQQALSSLHRIAARGNFYKCGDELPKPHFLAWRDIKAPQPDFHLPQYFGNIQFE